MKQAIFALLAGVAMAGARRSGYVSPAYKVPASSYGYSKPSYSYSKPAYNDYSYDVEPSYGYSKPAYGHSYGYQPAIVKKDYGLWENYYRLEVETFKKTVATDTENVWVVAFIDPACGGCKRLSVQWEKLTTLETITTRKVKFGYMDITVESNAEIIQEYTAGSIEMTPTVYVYGRDKYHPIEYDGDYTSASLNKFICGYCDRNGYGVARVSHGLDDLRSIGKAALNGEYDNYYGHDDGYYGHGHVDGDCGLEDYGYGYDSYGHGDAYGRYGYDDGYYGNGYGAYGRRGYGYSSPAYGYGYDDGYYGDSYGRGYGYDDGYYGHGYDDGYYGHGHGYYAEPKVVATYGKTSNSRVEKTEYDRSVDAGRSYGGYERTSIVKPAYNNYW